jgi:hypothetical protein
VTEPRDVTAVYPENAGVEKNEDKLGDFTGANGTGLRGGEFF